MFYGRDEILSDLSALYKKRGASLVTCRGRRRIGKSTLIEVFAEKAGAKFLKIEGLKPKEKLTNDDELANFAAQLAVQTGCESTPPQNWLNAFVRLDREIPRVGRVVVLLDEVSWMACYDPTFAGTLKIAWDNYFKKHDRLILVVCGSVSSWIKDNIIDDGSFYGRRSLDVVVPELPLRECVKFWGRAAQRLDVREILDVLSVTGGVPRYLEEIEPGASATENIRKMCFRPKGILREDFGEMFNDVITRQPTFTSSVLRCLEDGARSVSEIASSLNVEKGGRISNALQQLVEAGIVAADEGLNPLTGRKGREVLYRMRDNYSRFYLKYIEPAAKMIDEDAFEFGSLDRLEGWESIMGLSFENLVVNNFRNIVGAIGLGTAQILSAAPYRREGDRKRGGGGVQIDLLLQTRRSVCLVEVKRQREIGREIIDEVDEKVQRLPRRQGISVRTALVYEGHLAPIVEADGYFDAVVPFRSLLGL